MDHAAATHRCEQLIRAYDPCISCATHFLDLADRARMTRVRVIALGNEMACDDGAALEAARRLEARRPADRGRSSPGVRAPGLLDLLDPAVPTVLVDVVRIEGAIGHVIEMPLAEVASAAVDRDAVSSHAFGVAASLRLAGALERPLPPGIFIGIAGRCFDPGDTLDPEVASCIDDLVDAAAAAADALAGA